MAPPRRGISHGANHSSKSDAPKRILSDGKNVGDAHSGKHIGDHHKHIGDHPYHDHSHEKRHHSKDLSQYGEVERVSICLRRIAESADCLHDVHRHLTDYLAADGSPLKHSNGLPAFIVPTTPRMEGKPMCNASNCTVHFENTVLENEGATSSPDDFGHTKSINMTHLASVAAEGKVASSHGLPDTIQDEHELKAPGKSQPLHKYSTSWSRLDTGDISKSAVVDSIVMDTIEDGYAQSRSSKVVASPSLDSRLSKLSSRLFEGDATAIQDTTTHRENKKARFGKDRPEVVTFTYRDIQLRRACGSRILYPIIHPEAKLRLLWMMVGFLFIVYEAYAIPVYLAFNVNASDSGGLFAFISIVNSYFLFDIFMTFCTGYTDAHSGHTVMDPKHIALRYVQGWFMCDLIAGIPWEWISTEESAARLTRSFRFVRAFRLLRLTRLLRLIKLKTVVDKVETFIEANQIFTFLVGIVRILLLLFAVTHWVACAWYVVGAGDGYQETWVKSAGLESATGWQCYVHALYYALTTMTTVGYGDITPKNLKEVQMSLAILFVSSIAFAGIMGTLMDLISELNRQKHVLSEKKMLLSRYMHWRIVPRKLMMAIRTHLLFLWDTNEGYDAYENELKDLLPPVLKMELCYHIYGRVLSAAPFFVWMRDYAVCVKHIANTVQCVFVEKGDHLFRLGQANTEIHMLISGEVFLSRNEMLYEDTLQSMVTHANSNQTDQHNDSPFAIPRHKDRSLLDLTLDVFKSGKAKTKKRKTEIQKKAQQAMVIAHLQHEVAEHIEEHQHSHPGLNIPPVMQDAHRALQRQDEKRDAAARFVQERWRAKLVARKAARKSELRRIASSQARNSTHEFSSKAAVLEERSGGRSVSRMLSKLVQAPAYFGESCLWVPFDDWSNDYVDPPKYMYSCRCETRGERIVIDRVEIQEMINKFGPWLAERFEYFRDAVVEGYVNDGIQTSDVIGSVPGKLDSATYRVPDSQYVDWAVADMDLPEMTETIPVEAFTHMNTLTRATCTDPDAHMLSPGRRSDSRRRDVGKARNSQSSLNRDGSRSFFFQCNSL